MNRAAPFLFSYAYLRQDPSLYLAFSLLRDRGFTQVIVDSGAFTAHRIGETIDLAEYIEWCKANAHGAWGVIQLDSIGHADVTLDNLDRMVKAGVTPMPVLTTDMPVAKVKEFVQINKRLCIAGALGKWPGAAKWIVNRYVTASRLAGKGAQLHGLAFVRWPTMFQVGLASVDSSSHNSGGRYGLLWSFAPATGISCTSYRDVVAVAWEQMSPELQRFLSASGVTLAEFRDETWATRHSCSLTWLSTTFAAMSQAVVARERWNVVIFQAIADMHQLALFAVCARHARGDLAGIDVNACKRDKAELMKLEPLTRARAVVDMFEENAQWQ